MLTFHHVLNYGAVLQCWALKLAIERNGYNCDVVSYVCPHLLNVERGLRFNKKLPIALAKKLSQGYGNCKKKANFNAFLRQELNMHDRSCNDVFSNYSAFVVGSDQVWNLCLTGNDYTYFLENRHGVKKIAYAASFGEDDIPEAELKRVLADISEFDAVSIREKRMRDFLAEKGVEAEYVVDPVFLLSKENWTSNLDDTYINESERYILVYCVEKSATVFNYAKQLSRETGLKIIYLNQNLFFKEKGMIYRRGVGPKEFLKYLEHADYVVTNSFHGTALSIIFEKNVAVDTVLHEKNNRRITELLDTLGLNPLAIQADPKGKKISFDYAKKIIDSMSKKSEKFLQNALEKR